MLGDGLVDGRSVERPQRHPAAARAAFQLGIMHRDAARFDEAVDAFNQAGFSDDVFGPLVDANLGDCYVELGDLEAAQSHFASAASAAGAGLAAVPLPPCAYKQALVLIELGNTSKAQRVLEDLASDYPNSTYVQRVWPPPSDMATVGPTSANTSLRTCPAVPTFSGHCCV